MIFILLDFLLYWKFICRHIVVGMIFYSSSLMTIMSQFIVTIIQKFTKITSVTVDLGEYIYIIELSAIRSCGI